jgi:hypothetical protein
MSNPIDAFWYTSAMAGSVQLPGQPGKLIDVIDSCLISGFGSKTLSSLTVASGLATATVSTGHEFLDHVVALVEGSTPSGLNGKKRITVINSTTFTFDATGISDQTATGTITAKMAPPGTWTKAFSGTNTAAYQSTDIASLGMYCRVDDSAGTYARVRGYLTIADQTEMDADNGATGFPNNTQMSGGGYWHKSNASSSATRAWALYADEAAFYLFTDPVNDGTFGGGGMFGDAATDIAIDPYSCMVNYSSSSNPAVSLTVINTFGGTAAAALARSISGTGGSVLSVHHSNSRSTTMGYGAGAMPVYNAAAVDLRLWPVEAWETDAYCRGLMPGLWNPVVKFASLAHSGTVKQGIVSLPGRQIRLQITGAAGSGYYTCGIDITGPWR